MAMVPAMLVSLLMSLVLAAPISMQKEGTLFGKVTIKPTAHAAAGTDAASYFADSQLFSAVPVCADSEGTVKCTGLKLATTAEGAQPVSLTGINADENSVKIYAASISAKTAFVGYTEGGAAKYALVGDAAAAQFTDVTVAPTSVTLVQSADTALVFIRGAVSTDLYRVAAQAVTKVRTITENLIFLSESVYVLNADPAKKGTVVPYTSEAFSDGTKNLTGTEAVYTETEANQLCDAYDAVTKEFGAGLKPAYTVAADQAALADSAAAAPFEAGKIVCRPDKIYHDAAAKRYTIVCTSGDGPHLYELEFDATATGDLSPAGMEFISLQGAQGAVVGAGAVLLRSGTGAQTKLLHGTTTLSTAGYESPMELNKETPEVKSEGEPIDITWTTKLGNGAVTEIDGKIYWFRTEADEGACPTGQTMAKYSVYETETKFKASRVCTGQTRRLAAIYADALFVLEHADKATLFKYTLGSDEATEVMKDIAVASTASVLYQDPKQRFLIMQLDTVNHVKSYGVLNMESKFFKVLDGVIDLFVLDHIAVQMADKTADGKLQAYYFPLDHACMLEKDKGVKDGTTLYTVAEDYYNGLNAIRAYYRSTLGIRQPGFSLDGITQLPELLDVGMNEAAWSRQTIKALQSPDSKYHVIGAYAQLEKGEFNLFEYKLGLAQLSDAQVTAQSLSVGRRNVCSLVYTKAGETFYQKCSYAGGSGGDGLSAGAIAGIVIAVVVVVVAVVLALYFLVFKKK